jgi:hypothetical protein
MIRVYCYVGRVNDLYLFLRIYTFTFMGYARSVKLMAMRTYKSRPYKKCVPWRVKGGGKGAGGFLWGRDFVRVGDDV